MKKDMNQKLAVKTSLVALLVAVSGMTVSPISAQLELLPGLPELPLPPLPILSSTVTLSVESADMGGNTFEGMWVELWQDSVIIDEGFTPFSASVENGVTYQVSINDGTEENSSFSHWEDGSTDPMRTITPTEDTTLTAFFQT